MGYFDFVVYFCFIGGFCIVSFCWLVAGVGLGCLCCLLVFAFGCLLVLFWLYCFVYIVLCGCLVMVGVIDLLLQLDCLGIVVGDVFGQWFWVCGYWLRDVDVLVWLVCRLGICFGFDLCCLLYGLWMFWFLGVWVGAWMTCGFGLLESRFVCWVGF